MILILILLCVFGVTVFGQKVDFAVFDGKGNRSSLEEIANAAKAVDVVFLGELHDDSVGHRIQFEIFKGALEKYSGERSISLSLEMFERDVQIVMDEYLSGFIPEKQFLDASRPWGNYATDYRPLVELAKENKIPVIAANAPRRYVNMVSRLGRDSLLGLTLSAKHWLAPLPYGEASKDYADKFNALMGSMSDGASSNAHNPILNSQSLWDATMAYSIAEQLKTGEKALVVHLNGGFHTEKRLGTPEHLLKYKSDANFLVVTIRYEDDFNSFNIENHTDVGDFVILTDSSAPRSKR